MNQSIDYTTELAQLMKFAGLTATAIRMYSAYNGHGYSDGIFGAKRADPARSPLDLMFLADALHHFERIGDAVEGGVSQTIISTCDDILSIYETYEVENPRFGERQSKPTFELWSNLVHLNDAKMALSSIRGKAAGSAKVRKENKMYEVGVLGKEFIEGADPAPNEEAAIKMAYDRSLADNQVHAIMQGGQAGFLVWGGTFFKLHSL